MQFLEGVFHMSNSGFAQIMILLFSHAILCSDTIGWMIICDRSLWSNEWLRTLQYCDSGILWHALNFLVLYAQSLRLTSLAWKNCGYYLYQITIPFHLMIIYEIHMFFWVFITIKLVLTMVVHSPDNQTKWIYCQLWPLTNAVCK